MARFDCAVWKPVGNHGGAMSRNMGLLLHHAVANGSLFTQFNTPGPNAVSAHFWVSKSGLIEQYVDSETIAWHAMQMNDTYCGVETEGCSTSPYAEPMTDAMVESLAILYKEGNLRHGWPNELANADGQLGFGYHRMGVATACPCDIRLNRRQEILNIAFGGAPAPTPKPPGGGAAAPPFPYPPGHYLGQPSSDPYCHSGFYGGVDNVNVSTWQSKMLGRGWTISVDGKYGTQSDGICRQFQAEKGLEVDGWVGTNTWKASWESPIT